MLTYSILFLLLSNAVTLRRDKSILYSRNLIYILIIAFVIGLSSLNLKSLNSIGILGGLFHTTSITNTFHIFIFFVCAIICQLTAFYPRKIWTKEYSNLRNITLNKFIYFNTKILNKMGEQFKIVEYPLILLFIITGATFLISSSDIVSIFISIELQSYGLYLLSTLYRNSELSTSAGLTYFLLGGLSSCFILLGISLLYVNSGTTSLDGYYIITNISEFKNNITSLYSIDYINFSLLIMSVGFLFKISAAPFHFWSPDVYDAIPTIVTTFVAIIAKISIFIFLLELVHFTNNFNFAFNFNWTITLLFSSLLSLIIGTVLGLNQFRIKRLFAYSTISHLGFILLALSINSIESIQAFIFYLMQYSIANLNAFIILISIGYTYYIYINSNNEDDDYKKLLDKNNSPIQLISQIKGYFSINPVLSISFIITIYSLVGIPPLVGFFGKQMVLSAALDNGYIFMVLVAILTSVISAVYYLNIVKQIFFDTSDYKINPQIKDSLFIAGIKINENKNKKITFKINNIVLSNSLTITISYLTLIILLFIFNPQEWLSIANILALLIFN
jgi:NADH-ubiquinone oxidoreductase chain 2